ncbi:hypothetical protein V8V88_09940 [Paenibacillus phytohabitans]
MGRRQLEENTISVKFEGFDELERNLNNLQNKVQQLEETETVAFTDLFITSFMREYTDYSSFEELLEAGGFEVNSQEDFQNIPDDVFDKHIAEHTKFDNWGEMLQQGTNEYIARELGF